MVRNEIANTADKIYISQLNTALLGVLATHPGLHWCQLARINSQKILQSLSTARFAD